MSRTFVKSNGSRTWFECLPGFSEPCRPRCSWEAMACGAPVVASRAGGLPEVIDDGVSGILEPVGSVEAMGRRAVELLRDPKRHAAMRAAAVAKAERFSADRIVPMY